MGTPTDQKIVRTETSAIHKFWAISVRIGYGQNAKIAKFLSGFGYNLFCYYRGSFTCFD